MNKNDLIREVRAFCTTNANEENALKYSRYFKVAPQAYGLSQPQMNEKSKELLKSKQFDFETLKMALPDLLRSKMYEEITIALLLMNGFEKQYSKETFKEIGNWFEFTIDNWAHADTLGMFILPKFLKRGIIQFNDFESWLLSPYKYQRRCIPVSLIKTLKTNPDFSSIFHFIEPLILDQAREVHQGVGWFLREAWKLKGSETERFLMKWKDQAPRLIIQYATEKMTKEEKLPFRRVK